MNLPSDSPRLPKWIFFVAWALLVATAYFIYDGSSHPWSGGPLLAIVVCVALAAVLIAVPFIADYAHNQDEALDNRQRSLQTLAATVASSSEQIAIATAGLQKLTSIAQENAAQSERLAQLIQDRVAELRASVTAVKTSDSDAVAKLDAAAKKISKVASELETKAAKLPEAARAVPVMPAAPAPTELPPVLLSKMVEIKPAVSGPSHSPFETPAAIPPVVPEPPPAAPMAAPAEPEPAPAPVTSESVVAAPAAAEVPAEASRPPPRKRSPRKPPAPVQPAADLVLESSPPETPTESSPPEIAEPAVSSDGATRLVVTAYIGIGNRLTIRGDGPGLSWEKGVPLSFVSIGKWRWETNDATAPVKFKLYKNDEIECTALGERSVAPGAQQDLSASF
jgi:hypothetical protein